MTNPVDPYVLPGLGVLVLALLLLVAAHRWDVGDWPRRGGGPAGNGPRPSWIKVTVFAVALVGLFVRTGDLVTAASGGARRADTAPSGLSAAAGEQIFWGAGKCHTCHSVGARGGKIRGPNLGVAAEGASPAAAGASSGSAALGRLAIGARAVAIAAERAAALGRPLTGTDYLVESIADPSAYLAPGYKDEMPKAYLPPISLTADQVTSVILYLQSLGGTPDPAAIHLPAAVMQAAGPRATAPEPWKPYFPGDSARGEKLFFDPHGVARCATCHRVADRGGTIGPELTSEGSSRSPQFIVESMLEPGTQITDGYETFRLHTRDGRTLDGVVHRQSADSLWLGTSQGDLVAVPKGTIATRTRLDGSIMPADLAKRIALQDFQDLLAFLQALQPYVTGDPARGRTLFLDVAGRAACAKCHRLGSEGGDAGPDIRAVVAIRSPSFLLDAILKPSKHIASGYQTVRIRTGTGGAVEGVVVRETADSVWLGTADGRHVTVPTRGILERRALESSLMPDTLGKALSARDLGDLMAFLETLR